MEALERAVHAVGLDFHTIEIEQLTQQIAIERRTTETLRAQLATAMALGQRGTPER